MNDDNLENILLPHIKKIIEGKENNIDILDADSMHDYVFCKENLNKYSQVEQHYLIIYSGLLDMLDSDPLLLSIKCHYSKQNI